MVTADCAREDLARIDELRRQFLQFQKATSELQEAYRSLKERAALVDRELAETNRELRRSLEERDRILQSMPLGVFRQEGDNVQCGNEQGQRLMNLLGPGLVAELSRIAPGTGVTRLKVEGRDGKSRNLEVTSLDLGGSGSGKLHFVVDQSEVLALQEEVSRLDRMEGLATLSLGVAHEIRNPLNGVRGYASLLRRNPESRMVGRWAERIELGVLRVERIVRDLLAFARPEKRGERKSMSLSSWLEQVDEDLEVFFPPEDGRILIEADELAFPAVLENLVRNAREAGATKIGFRVRERRGNLVCIQVEDDGPGIPRGWRERIFDPFVSGKDNGTGLGLAFCRKAMESMVAGPGGGIIALNDGVPGARFEFWVQAGRGGANA